MGGNSPAMADRGDWDDAQLLEIVHRAQGPEWTLVDGLVAFVSRKNYVEIARKWEKGDVVKVVDAIDQTLGSTDLSKPQGSVLLQALGSICSATGQLPHAVILSSGLQKCGDIAVASGGFTDTWRGRYKTKNVALKAFRTYPSQDLKEAKKVLWKQVAVWKRLSHENVLQFHGVDMKNFQLALVYDWEDSGNIIQYLGLNPGDSRTRLLRETAEGLHYLHSYGVAHGDLKGANVLISQDGHARLSDYGLMPVQSNHAFMVAATPGAVGISRWLAPELIDPPRKKGYKQPAATKEADIFAFAMLGIEVFTEELPFGDVRHETAILMIVRGQRPEKPSNIECCGFTPEMWKFVQRCWRQNPDKRPDIDVVVSAWRDFYAHERARTSTPATRTIYPEKHRFQAHKPFTASTKKSKKTRFCGLF